MRRALISLLGAIGLSSCIGTTGGGAVDFPAAAAGPSDATGQSLAFTTDRGWAVTLTKATLHVGAVYLDQSVPTSGSGATQCVLPGTYLLEVTSGADINLLSAVPTPFPSSGHGITGVAAVAQVWLTGGDINAVDDSTRILVIEGTASRAGDVRPFTGVLTIGENRESTGSLAGADPPCKQRIASIPTSVRVQSGGGFLMRVDPRQLFLDVDFSQLIKSTTSDTYAFQDNSNDAASSNLYSNLHAGGTLYSFEWVKTTN